jgi:hypothetical protein
MSGGGWWFVVLATVLATPAKPDLTGEWQLRSEQSDDRMRNKMLEDRLKQRPADRRALAEHRETAAARWTVPAEERCNALLDVLIRPAAVMTITQSDTAIALETAEGCRRIFCPNEQTQLDAALREVRASLASGALVVETKRPNGRRTTETFRVIADPRRLIVTVDIEMPSGSPHTIRRVYEPPSTR